MINLKVIFFFSILSIPSQVFSTSTEAAETTVSFSSPTETDVPFQWAVVKNHFNHWQVTSSDIAKGYNSTNTGAILYGIEHLGSSLTGQTEWMRVRRRPGGPPVPLIKLSWEEISSSKSIASNYKSGTITVSGTMKNLGVAKENFTNSCTITVQ